MDKSNPRPVGEGRWRPIGGRGQGQIKRPLQSAHENGQRLAKKLDQIEALFAKGNRQTGIASSAVEPVVKGSECVTHPLREGRPGRGVRQRPRCRNGQGQVERPLQSAHEHGQRLAKQLDQIKALFAKGNRQTGIAAAAVEPVVEAGKNKLHPSDERGPLADVRQPVGGHGKRQVKRSLEAVHEGDERPAKPFH